MDSLFLPGSPELKYLNMSDQSGDITDGVFNYYVDHNVAEQWIADYHIFSQGYLAGVFIIYNMVKDLTEFECLLLNVRIEKVKCE